MADPIKLIECPRDAWQGLQSQIPADLKADYLKALISVGFKHIDAVSFVSPKAVPQMADSEDVLKLLDPPDDVEIIAIVVNEKGAQRAIDTRESPRSGFPIRFPKPFCARTRTSLPKTRSKNLKRFRRRPTTPGWAWSSISQWRSAILMATRGTYTKLSKP